ncbi:MAG TPA: hypothetical protein VM033_00965 [Gemmatimonadaceae bacterium]|nr:hypothetical protein [Gemmatimonadaceae bacterium]
MTDEARARFLAGIAGQLPRDLVKEIHLFGAIRQGGAESGVAVIAVERAVALTLDDESPVVANAAVDDAMPVDEARGSARTLVPPARYTVYTARYRHTLKGLDRGKWEMSVTEEADAPLLTVDAVVRGVSRRSGDVDESVRLTGDEFRAALPEPARA